MRSLLAFALCLFSSVSMAQVKTPAENAFEKLKTLAGTWKIVGGTDTVTYEVQSEGNSLVETEYDMVTVYHLDGESLLMTHYCDIGNQPRMRATKFDPSLVSLTFEFVDVSNLKPNTSYINGLTIEWLANGNVRQNWSERLPSGSDNEFSFELERVANTGSGQ